MVDQGEPSATADVLEGARRAGLVVHHLVQAQRGLSVSQNAGVRAAGSLVVAVVDDDCVPDARWLAVVEEAFAAAAGPLLLTGRILALPAQGARTRAVDARLPRRLSSKSSFRPDVRFGRAIATGRRAPGAAPA